MQAREKMEGGDNFICIWELGCLFFRCQKRSNCLEGKDGVKDGRDIGFGGAWGWRQRGEERRRGGEVVNSGNCNS